MYRRICAALLAMLFALTALCASAEGMTDFQTFDEALYELTDAEWVQTKSPNVIEMSPEEGVLISVCLEGEDVAAVTVESLADGPWMDYAVGVMTALGCTDAVLEAFAYLDAETAEWLAEEGYAIGMLKGETRRGAFVCMEADYANLLWQPVHGGKKVHLQPDCSGMDVPRLITPIAAEGMGFELCKICGN